MTEEEQEPEIDQPGLSQLREAVAYAGRHVSAGRHFRKDAVAGLNSAVASVPDGMASGLLAGVNPIHGLYACMAGPIAGGIVSSTSLMVVTTTSAAALGAGQALESVSPENRGGALFVMAVLIGVFQITFGLLRLGRLTRFISYSVMTGFIMGIAILTVLTQLPTATGYVPSGDSRITQTFNILLNLSDVSFVALGLTVVAIVSAVALRHTWIGNFSSLFAIVIPSLVVALFNAQVQKVGDVGDIQGGLPLPSLPSLGDLQPAVVTGAIAIAAIILVQGAGVSQSVPNPDGTRRSMSRDFVGQGAANVASGLFRGLPVGGSLGSTALSVLAGARSRAAAIFAGVWMAIIVTVFSGLITYVAMPTLAALLMLASLSTIKPKDVRSIWSTGWHSRIAAGVTFFATLLLPIQYAVALGVSLSGLLYIVKASTDVSVVELVERDDGHIEERKSPRELKSNEVTVLDVYGHLFFAGARTLERLLPEPAQARDSAVVLRLRGRTSVGATLIEVLTRYADKLAEGNGRLYLSGLSHEVHDEIVRSGKLALDGPVRAFQATPLRGESTREALAEARTWLLRTSNAGPD